METGGVVTTLPRERNVPFHLEKVEVNTPAAYSVGALYTQLAGFLPVSRPVVGWWAVESFDCSQQPLARRHWGWQANVLGVQRLILMIFQLKETKQCSCHSHKKLWARVKKS